MSRSALDKEEMRAAQARQLAMASGYGMHGYGMSGYEEEQQEKKKEEIPQHGNQTTFNVNKLLFDRICESDYFHALEWAQTFQDITDEVQRKVTHVEPWSAGTSRNPSTAWCLLVKYCHYRLTVKQVNSLVRREGQPLVRAMGFLYLRVVTDPKGLWDWFEEFMDDPEEFAPGTNSEQVMTMGRFLSKLLGEMKFYDTMLPRIPVPIERKMKAYMILLEDEQKRAASNLRVMHLLQPGAKVQAVYKDEETDPAFYAATVQEVVPPEAEGRRPKVVVTFDDYGNTELLALGKVMLPDAAAQDGPAAASDHGGGGDAEDRHRENGDTRRRSRSRDRRRSRSRSRDRDRGKGRSPPNAAGGGGGGSLLASVMGKVQDRDREKSAASGKDYAQRPASYKGSLSLKLDRYTARKRSRSRSPEHHRGGGGGGGGRGGVSMKERRERDQEEAGRSGVYESSSRHRVPADDARDRYLKDRYGDASRN